MDQPPPAFWSISAPELLKLLQTTPEGLTGGEARRRLTLFGANLLRPRKRTDALETKEHVDMPQPSRR